MWGNDEVREEFDGVGVRGSRARASHGLRLGSDPILNQYGFEPVALLAVRVKGVRYWINARLLEDHFAGGSTSGGFSFSAALWP